jgi:hypothetical protein
MKGFSKAALLALVLMVALACDSAEKKADDTGTVDDGSTEETSPEVIAAGCDDCGGALVGKAMRFSSLFVTEPADPNSTTDGAIRDFLNGMWTRDMENEILNILFVIKAYDMATGSLTVEVGPAWRFPDGDFHFICGYSDTYELKTEPGSCDFTNEAAPGKLNFHTGPKNDPVLCAPDVAPTNSIPISDLITEATLQTDCDASTVSIEGATLSGWILETDADMICSCNNYDPDTKTYTCDSTPDPDHDNYCFKNCGSGYSLFGPIMKIIAQVAPKPNPQGLPSFKIAGFYAADTIANFNSTCCDDEATCGL